MHMKNTLLFATPAALLLAGGLQAQRLVVAPTSGNISIPSRATMPVLETGTSQDDARDGGDILFEENFANGLDGNNSVGPWSTSGPDGAIWLYDTDGPNGDFSSTTQRILSPSVNNGFMIFDSNFSNNGCTSCVSWTGALESPVLDLSSTPYVHLKFTQRLRWCCAGASAHFVDISLDGGSTWTIRIPAVQNQWTNYDPGSYTRYINLHEHISANASSVRFRFNHDGSASNSSHYYWQIDDVQIVESADNDLDLLRPRFASFLPNVSSTSELEYSVYPFSQVRELSAGSPVRNQGQNEATNVSLDVAVTGPGSAAVFSGNATTASIAASATDSNLRVAFTPPQTAGTYSVGLTLSMDQTDDLPLNNTATRTFDIDPYVYAYDKGSRDDYFRNTQNGVAMEHTVGNLFWVEQEATVYGLQVALARSTTQLPGTVVGALFEGVLFEVDDEGNLIEVNTTDYFEVANQNQLTSNGQAKWFHMPLLAPMDLEAGREYLAAVRSYGGSGEVIVATSGRSESITSLLHRPYEAEPNWYIFGQTPMVRLTFNPSVGIEDAERLAGVGLGQNFPNPSNGTTTIPYDLARTAQVTMELFDLSGKLVQRMPQGTRAPGSYRIQLNTEALQAGVYFYTLTAGDTRITKRMVITGN